MSKKIPLSRLRRLRRKIGIKHRIMEMKRPRLVVFRSNKGIYGQVVDGSKVLAAASTFSKGLKGIKHTKDGAKAVGEHLAKLAEKKSIKRVVFDRGGYLYHGRVKSLAEGARLGGLEF